MCCQLWTYNYLYLFFPLQQMWVFDEDIGMNQREITYVPGLYKIFDEILGESIHRIYLPVAL